MKRCPRCGENKPYTQFYKDSSRLDGLKCWCKVCICDSNKKSRIKLVAKRKENPAAIPTTKTCPTCRILKSSMDFYRDISDHLGLYHECKNCFRDRKRVERYNLEAGQFDLMKKEQSNKCAWCGREEISEVFKSRLVVDHCHTTGKVRRLLCDGCNTAEGLLKHVPHIIAAIENVAWFPMPKM